MNYKLINVLTFAAGAVIGSAVTWKIVKDRYENLIQEEIASIRVAFSNTQSNEQAGDDTETTEDDEEEPDDFEDEDYTEYAELANNYKSEKGGAEDVGSKPYVISPYDFGELDYTQFELTYYADGILEDDTYEIVTDIEDLIGEDSLNTFGEYEDDSVFVRNDRLRADFQILRDYRTYDEARSISPGRVDD